VVFLAIKEIFDYEKDPVKYQFKFLIVLITILGLFILLLLSRFLELARMDKIIKNFNITPINGNIQFI